MTDSALEEVPVLEFVSASQAKQRPTVTFTLDGRRVVATAPKAAVWARLWVAGNAAQQSRAQSAEVAREHLLFLHHALGEETSSWLRSREYDPNDSWDLSDLLDLSAFLSDQFEPLLRPEWEALNLEWGPAGNREQRRGAAKARKATARAVPPARKAAAKRTAKKADR